MTMRITNRMMVDLAVRRMNDRLTQFESAQRQLATGKRIQVASDDVAGMNTVLDLGSAMAANTQAQRNIQDGIVWTEMADSRMAGIGDQLHRIRDLVIEANNAANGPSGYSAIATEIGQLAESIRSVANSRHHGRPIFGGFVGAEPIQSVAGVWTYAGDAGEVSRRVSETEVVTVNVTGDEVFGFAAGEDLFTVLDDLVANIGSGAPTGLDTELQRIDRAMDRLLAGRAAVGSARNRLDTAVVRSASDDVNLRTQLSETQDADMAAAIMEMQIQEVAYQAAQGALSKSLQSSLAQFLR